MVGIKWVYKVKYKSNDTVERYQTQLVAQGIHQQAAIDYHQTFILVVKATIVCLILLLIVSINWPLHQLDAKNIFLHGHLTEEVCMKQKPRFIILMSLVIFVILKRSPMG